jgi:hypothetical protein
MWKKIKPHIGDKAMSTSILNHTFNTPGVQHISTDFLEAKPPFIAVCMQIMKSVQIVNPAILYILEANCEPSRCFQWAIRK